MDGRGKKRHTVALCISRLHEETEQRIFQCMQKHLTRAGYRLLTFSSSSDLYCHDKNDVGERGIYTLIPYEQLDALVIASETIKDEELRRELVEKAKAAGVPVIAINRYLPGCYNILFNYGDSMEQIVRHVIRVHGCRKINFIAGLKDNIFSEERLDAYKRVLTEEGIPIEEERIGYGAFWTLPAKEVAERFLEAEELPDAIICANDTMAIAVCQVLAERGMRVPEDIIVTGMDGIEFERYHSPRLTTAAMDIETAVVTLLELLEALQRGEPVQEEYVIHHKVRFSQSCGCKSKGIVISNQQMQKLYDEVYRLTAFEHSMSNMVASVAASMDFAEAITRFDTYINEFSLEDISIYVIDNYLDSKATDSNGGRYPDQMIPIVNKRSGSYVQLPGFPTRQLAPDYETLIDKGDPLLLLPLHFQEMVLGILMIRVPEWFQDFRLLSSLQVNLNHTLGILRSQEMLRLALIRMEEMYSHDYMTGLLNRGGFFSGVKGLISRAQEQKKYIWVFSVDLNGLKDINDTYGHHEGDFALRKIAEVMSSCAGDGILCARFGGDEFTVTGISETPEADCEAFLGKVTARLREFNHTGTKPYEVSASFGYSYGLAWEGMTLDDLIREADEQMYQSKGYSRKHRSTRR